MEKDEKRLFLGAEIEAPWPKEEPPGRYVEPTSRHLTLSFFGNRSFSELEKNLKALPLPRFKVGPVGVIDRFLFIPEDRPRLVAAHVSELHCLALYQRALVEHLEKMHYEVDKREFLPHVTLARAPLDAKMWENSFHPLPVVIPAIHLYESVGNLTYKPLWSHTLIPPFEDLEHTADIAFTIRAETMQELYLHAQFALAFKYPPLVRYLSYSSYENLDDIIIHLNEIIAMVDVEIGAPFKAVSFHGQAKRAQNGLIQWEMIVDV